MCLPQAIFFTIILEEVGLMAMGLGKLELKLESALGQKRTFLAQTERVRYALISGH